MNIHIRLNSFDRKLSRIAGKAKFGLTALALAFSSTTHPSLAEPQRQASVVENLNSYFEQCEAFQICNGTVLIVEDGNVIFNKTMGLTGDGSVHLLSDGDQFDIGSITKQFTAAAIMRLHDKGLLSFDDDLRDHLPELPYEGVTLRHLLNHTSGLPESFGYYTQLYREGAIDFNITNDHLLQVLSTEDLPVVAAPGEEWAYLNTGYALLACVVERVSGVPFDIFLEAEFFNPLNMQDTIIRGPDNESKITDRTYGFRLGADGNQHPYDQIPYFYVAGSGGAYSTATDLHAWERALSARDVFSTKSWTEAITPATLNDGTEHPYGFGWVLKPSKMGENRVSHGGHWRGFRAALEMFPSKDRSIIILTNNGADDSVDQAIDDVEVILEGAPAPALYKSITRDLYQTISTRGIPASKAFYAGVIADPSSIYNVDESEMKSLGRLLYGNEKVREAVAIFEMTIISFPQSADAYQLLAEGYAELDDTKKAINALERALVLNPGTADIQERLIELKRAKS